MLRFKKIKNWKTALESVQSTIEKMYLGYGLGIYLFTNYLYHKQYGLDHSMKN